jgi:hypothetical protein
VCAEAVGFLTATKIAAVVALSWSSPPQGTSSSSHRITVLNAARSSPCRRTRVLVHKRKGRDGRHRDPGPFNLEHGKVAKLLSLLMLW